MALLNYLVQHSEVHELHVEELSKEKLRSQREPRQIISQKAS